MTKRTQLANSQSISATMAKGNTANLARIKARLLDHSPKVNHNFCPPTLAHEFTSAAAGKTARISKAGI